MSDHPAVPETAFEIYSALGSLYSRSAGDQALVGLVLRLLTEVEALRAALSDPAVPEVVRQRYLEAYARTAVLSHNAAGPMGGAFKILRTFAPKEPGDRFGTEVEMLRRLGASTERQEEVCKKMEEVEWYT